MFNGVKAKATRLQMIKAAIWLACLTILFGGALLADSKIGLEPGTFNQSVEVASGPTSVATPLNLSETVVVNDGTNSVQARPEDDVPKPGSQANQQIVASVDDLPAWRWSNFTLESASDTGFLNANGTLFSISSNIATFAFFLANLLWTALLGLMKFGLSTNFLDSMAAQINTAVFTISNKLWPFLGLIWAVVLFRGVRYALKGHIQKALIGAVGFSIAAGAFLYVGNNSENAKSSAVQGTLPWMAQKVVGTLDSAGSTLYTGFGISNSDNYTPAGRGNQGIKGDVLTCDNYINQLYASYTASNGGNSSSVADPKVRNIASLSLMSKLWQTTFYNSWVTAQFGPTQPNAAISDLGGRVACHQVETNSGIPSTEQAAIGVKAYGDIPLSPKLYGPYSDDRVKRMSMTAWAACQYVGGWSATAPFKGQLSANTISDETCAKPANESGMAGGISDAKHPFNIYWENRGKMAETVEQSEGRGVSNADLRASKVWNEAYYGGNAGDRITQGALAFIVSLFFFLSLGFVALGLVAAQFMLILLLILAPITIIFLALGSPQGMRLVKLTGTTAASKFLFVVLIGFLAEVITLGQSLIATVGSGSGVFNQLLYGIMPIIALVIVKKLLSNMGLGDIMKPTGALSFMAASSLAATRDTKWSKMVSNSSQNGNSLLKEGAGGLAKGKLGRGLNKLDSAGAVALAAGGNAASKATKKATEKTSKVAKETATSVINGAKGMKEPGSKTRAYAEYVRAGKLKDLASVAKNDMANGVSSLGASALGGIKSISPNALLAKAGIGAAGAGGAAAGISAVGAMAGAGAASLAALPLSLSVLALGGAAIGVSKAIKKNQENKRTAEAEPFSVNKDVYTASPNSALRANEQIKRDIKRTKDGAARIEKETAYTENLLNAASAQKVGEDFDGFVSVGHHAGAMESYAATLGVQRNEVLVSSQGLAMPAPLPRNEAKQKFDIEGMAHGIHWLSDDVKVRRSGETDDTYTARMQVELASVGLVTADGMNVNAFEKMGLNLKNTADVVRIEKWMDGGKDELLDSTVYVSADSKATENLIQRSVQWVAAKEINVAQRRHYETEVMIETVREAESSMTGFNDRISATSSNFGKVNADFVKALNAVDAAQGDFSASPEVIQKAMETRANERRNWESKAAESINSMFGELDSVNLLELNLKSPTMKDTEEFANVFEQRASELENLQAEILSTQAKASRGDTSALSQLTGQMDALEMLITQRKSEVDSLMEKNKEILKEYEKNRATDQSRFGTGKPVVRGTDFLRNNGSFPE